ncbi:hypothetical protein QUG98_09750 [Curtobacterium sp. RHCJP20]|uniref:Uncharacterized protein n=1 Tax=Curtobacterium subtropicum TaxID=3055138 RepID=A0ABT7TII5_9MICO|nr:hypothetical protein [Curtobacterium subtropicum]MDM7888737.1 hypothetical protein [Curtobacterium subtropicum]
MSEQQKTTQAMTARTQTFSYKPSQTTEAARSLAEVDRIRDPERRYEAFARHMAQFPPTIASY